MEIQVKIDGQMRTFKQDTVNFKTIRKCLEWKEYIDASTEKLTKVLTTPIDEDTDEEIVDEIEEAKSEINPFQDLDMTLDLIMAFFEGHFTLDEFLNGCYFEHIGQFYELGWNIYLLAIEQKKESEDKGKKKSRNNMRKISKNS